MLYKLSMLYKLLISSITYCIILFQIVQANTDTNSIKHHTLNNAAMARYVRFYPVTRSNFPCMRAEVYVQ